jgi:hypothetical protein
MQCSDYHQGFGGLVQWQVQLSVGLPQWVTLFLMILNSALLLRSVGRSVRRGQWGVCPECQQEVEGICRAITKQVQRSDARIEVDVMHTWNECTE